MSEFSDKERERLAKEYTANVAQKTIKVLVTGEHGTGKTQLMRTARKPVHIDSFDPGGTKGLQDLIETGAITVDAEYEQEDPAKPTAFKRWINMLEYRIERNYFEEFGTYCIDSATFLLEAIMNASLDGKDAAPKWQTDYYMQKRAITRALRRILNLNCDVFMTAHLRERYENGVGVSAAEQLEERTFLGYRFFAPGQAAVIVPTMFDEIWVTMAESYNPAQQTQYYLITEKSGAYLGKTRLGRGKFQTKEKPDVKILLKKLGWDTEDKPFTRIGDSNAKKA